MQATARAFCLENSFAYVGKCDRYDRRVFSIALAVRRRRPLLRYTRDVEVSNPEGVSATNGSSPLAVVESAVPYHASLRREVDLP